MENLRNFVFAYDNLPFSKRNFVKTEIKTKCGWRSDVTFHGKRKGKRKIKKLEEPVIEQTFRENCIDAWTGEPLKQLL